MFSRYQVVNLPCLTRGTIKLTPRFRSCHSAIAKFTTIDSKCLAVSHETGIKIGEPDESYMYVEPEVGNAIKSAIIHPLGSGVTGYDKTLPLQYYHDSRHFAHSTYFPEFDSL